MSRRPLLTEVLMNRIEALFQGLLSGELPVTPASALYFLAGRESRGTLGKRFEFLKAHFDQVVSQVPAGMFSLLAELPKVGEGFCDAQSRSDLKTYFEPRM